MFLMLSALGAAGLAGGLAILPILVHLLHRQRVTPIAWGAMQFLLESPLKVKRRRRIDNWLLMFLRIAILAVLALLLARPVLKTDTLRASAPMDVAIVLDHSMTMGTRAPNRTGTLYEQGIDILEQAVRLLPNSASISVVLAESSPRIMTRTPVKIGPSQISSDGIARGEWAKDLSLLRQFKPGMSKGDIPKAVAAARDLLASGYNTRKLMLIISDQQRTNWDPGAEALWRTAEGISAGPVNVDTNALSIYSIPLQTDAAALANVSVRAASVLPAFVGVHYPAQIFATLANTGSTDLTTIPVQLELDGKTVATQQVATLAAGASQTVRFDYYFPDAGSHWVRVKTDLLDALAADNAATAAVNVHPRLPVLVVDGQLTGSGSFPQAAFLVDAMQPVEPSLVAARVISAAEFSNPRGVRIDDYPIVILNDVPRLSRETVDTLADYARRGNGVLMILGTRTEESFVNEVLAKGNLVPVSTKGIVHPPAPADADAPAYASLDIKAANNPAVAVLTQGERNLSTAITLRSWWQIMPVAQEMRTIIATTSQDAGGGDPLVLEMDQGRLGGKTILWTTSVANTEWNNLPLAPQFFVPLVNETLFHLAAAQDQGQPRQVDAGKAILWTGPDEGNVDVVTVTSPDGLTHEIHPERRTTRYFVADEDTQQPGLYEMRFTAPAAAGKTPPPPVYFCVNIDPEELDPTVLSNNETAWFREHGLLQGVINTDGLATAMEAGNAPYEYWWLLGLLALALLVAEVALTSIQTRNQSGQVALT